MVNDNKAVKASDGKAEKEKKVATGKIFSRVFWLTIFLMFAINATFYIASITQDKDTELGQDQTGQVIAPAPNSSPRSYEIQSTVLQTLLGDSLAQTVMTMTGGDFIVDGVDALYAPVYASVPKFTDAHYTVTGGYSEIWGATFGDPVARVEEGLFDGFNNRLNVLVNGIDTEFNTALVRNFDSRLDQELPEGVDRSNVSIITETIIDDTMERIKVSAPVSTIASASGALGAKVVAEKLSAKFVAALALKTGAKFAAKSGASILGGAATGAAAGAALGPVGAAIGGAGAAVAIWLGVDKLFVEGAEFFNRDSFEAELISRIDESKEDTRIQLLAAVVQKAEEIESFTLRDLNAQ
jgi:hypothetical protein